MQTTCIRHWNKETTVNEVTSSLKEMNWNNVTSSRLISYPYISNSKYNRLVKHQLYVKTCMLLRSCFNPELLETLINLIFLKGFWNLWSLIWWFCVKSIRQKSCWVYWRHRQVRATFDTENTSESIKKVIEILLLCTHYKNSNALLEFIASNALCPLCR